MADKKISALTAATTPLVGTEVLPIVQSNNTVKVTVDNLTAGKDVTGKSFTSTNASGNGILGWNSVTFTRNGANYIQATQNNITYGATQHIFTNATLGTEFARITTAGNYKPAVAGTGIDFSANTHAAGMTSELLTWYEEGTFNAQVTDGTNNAVMNARTCRYTRIGRQVFVHGNVSTTSVAGLSGAIYISGLPFTISGFSGGSVAEGAGFAITAGYGVNVSGSNGQTRMNVMIWDAATGTTQMTAAEWSDDGNIVFGFTYTV